MKKAYVFHAGFGSVIIIHRRSMPILMGNRKEQAKDFILHLIAQGEMVANRASDMPSTSVHRQQIAFPFKFNVVSVTVGNQKNKSLLFTCLPFFFLFLCIRRHYLYINCFYLPGLMAMANESIFCRRKYKSASPFL